MANFNKVFLMGNLTRDPELRYLPNGTAVATFTIASNRTYALPSGEKKQEATFMRVVVWARRAETCAEFLNKGSPVFVEGRLQSRSWEGQDGQKRSTVEVVAENVQFLGRSKKQEAEAPAGAAEAQEPLDIVPDVDLPQENNRRGVDKKAEEEEEIPF